MEQDKEKLAKGNLSFTDSNILKLLIGEKEFLTKMIKNAEKCQSLIVEGMTLKKARQLISEYQDFDDCMRYVDIALIPLIKQMEGIGTGKAMTR
jgi:hypothetical protein